MTSTMDAPGGGAAPIEEREVSLAAPAHDLGPRIVSRDPGDFPVPTGREEEWRFTPLARLRGLHDGSAAAGEHRDLPVAWSATGAHVEVVPRRDPRVGAWYTPTDRVAAEALARVETAAVVSVPAGAAGASVVVELGGETDATGTRFGHVVVDVGDGARGTVVLEHTGAPPAVATNVEVHVGAGSSLTLVSNQLWDDDVVHVGHQHSVLAADAHLRSVVVSLGGSVVRHTASVEYRGRGGDADLVGVYFADAGQHLEHRLFVDHSVPDCRSDVIYKGALQGASAHTVWIGDVLIRAAATGTNTYELNRNLVLTEGARADSVPNLEIETGRIEGAGHASATGRFDDEQLFYLMSRGVPEAVARRLVVRGFFADAIMRIGVPEVAERLLAAVDAELGAVDPLYDFDDSTQLDPAAPIPVEGDPVFVTVA
ncbi:MAG: Fe-S cluster assembly protein SufD [Candidatus Nanopelagicales bacterium]